MSTSATGFACGKLILTGEHSVVYGFPAIAVGLSLGTRVTLKAVEGPTLLDGAEPDARLAEALARALPAEGLRVTIDSDLPVGCGMGSSAALSVALVRARAVLAREVLSPAVEFSRSLELEAVFHGTPSGLDNTVAAYGGAIRFERGAPPRFEQIPSPRCTLVVLESGEAGDTATLVAGVRQRHPANRPILEAMGALTTAIEASLDDLANLGPLLTENHQRLRELGVSTPTLDALVDLALQHGALGAKLSGAGGGGVVLALVQSPDQLTSAANAAGIRSHVVTLGGNS